MTTLPQSLTSWLLDQIAEDEADVAVGPENMRNYGLRWSPARVLAQCEAHRRIVENAAEDIAKADARVDEQIERSFNAGAAFRAHEPTAPK